MNEPNGICVRVKGESEREGEKDFEREPERMREKEKTHKKESEHNYNFRSAPRTQNTLFVIVTSLSPCICQRTMIY